jgi:hypothetical protein
MCGVASCLKGQRPTPGRGLRLQEALRVTAAPIVFGAPSIAPRLKAAPLPPDAPSQIRAIPSVSKRSHLPLSVLTLMRVAP